MSTDRNGMSLLLFRSRLQFGKVEMLQDAPQVGDPLGDPARIAGVRPREVAARLSPALTDPIQVIQGGFQGSTLLGRVPTTPKILKSDVEIVNGLQH